ncbi:MAG: DUF6803 family protein [Acetobacteraceae bacterium]|nr:permease [Pseudomonadota bacterium]
MSMTHYMQLLAENQPWNLLLFMAIPVILAETVAITELAVLFGNETTGPVRFLNRWAGILVGLYFAVVFVYLTATAAIPLTLSNGWRGPIDVIAVGFYLFGIVPLGGIALLELRVYGKGWPHRRWLGVHAALVGLFLITAHVAMIAGMLDPALAGGGGAATHQGHTM